MAKLKKKLEDIFFVTATCAAVGILVLGNHLSFQLPKDPSYRAKYKLHNYQKKYEKSERIEERFESLQGQVAGMESSTRINDPSGEQYLDRITLRLADGTYAHCWLSKHEYPRKELEKEYYIDIFEEPPDLETAIVCEINDRNVNKSRAPPTYKEWKQGKHYLIKEFYINGKIFKFE